MRLHLLVEIGSMDAQLPGGVVDFPLVALQGGEDQFFLIVVHCRRQRELPGG